MKPRKKPLNSVFSLKKSYDLLLDGKHRILLSIRSGTKFILVGDIADARVSAFFASYIEQWNSYVVEEVQAEFSYVKIAELIDADEHTYPRSIL